LFAVRNLGNRYFWSDEASSLYTSLGWPDAGETFGPLPDAWSSTLATHLEPGLFNVLERIWVFFVGASITELRLLPFTFFLIYVASLVGIARLLKLPWFLALAVPAILLLENITPYYAVELRPYSAGLAASVVLPLLAVLLIRQPGTGRLILFVAAVMLLGTMQYGTLPILIAVALLFFCAIPFVHQRIQRRLILVGALVSLLWQPVFYIATRGNPLAQVTSGTSPYPGLLLTDMPPDRVIEVVATNLLAPTGLPRTVFLIALPVLWVAGRVDLPTKMQCRFDVTLNAIWILVFGSTVVTALLAAVGIVPWILGTRWSIAEVGVIGISVAALLAIFARLVRWQRPPFVWAAVVGALLVTAAGAYRVATYERPSGVDWGPVFETILAGQPGGTVIDGWSFPELRYWAELSGDYPATTNAWLEHNATVSGGGTSADPSTVIEFLDSDHDRLLLRNRTVLEGIELPESIEVLTFGDTAGDSGLGPILLVK